MLHAYSAHSWYEGLSESIRFETTFIPVCQNQLYKTNSSLNVTFICSVTIPHINHALEQYHNVGALNCSVEIK